ncbi:hypothetical protein JCM1841_006198 [Sporobolomyces salmonicolor]
MRISSSYPVPGTSFTSLSTFLQSVQSVRPSLPQPFSSSSAPSQRHQVELLMQKDKHDTGVVVSFRITAELDPNPPRNSPRFLVTDYTPHSTFAHSFPWGTPSSQFSSQPLAAECEVEEREPSPEPGRAAQAQNDDDHHGPDYSPASPSRKPAPRVRQKASRHQTRDPVTGAFVRSFSSVGGIMSQASQHSHAGSTARPPSFASSPASLRRFALLHSTGDPRRAPLPFLLLSGAANSSPPAPISPYLSLLSPVIGRPPRPLLPSLNPSPLSSSSLARSHPRPPLPGSTSTSTHRRVSFALEYLYGRTITEAEKAHLKKRDKAFWGFVRTLAGVAEVNESYSTLEREERGMAVEERSWEERG